MLSVYASSCHAEFKLNASLEEKQEAVAEAFLKLANILSDTENW